MKVAGPMLRIILVAAMAVLIVAILAFVALFYSRGPSHTLLANPPGLLREVQQLSELVSVKYSIQKVVGMKEDKLPFGSESILLVVQGTVLGGVNLKEMEERDVRVEGDSVFIRMPQARILHVYLDDKNTRVWDRKITWWTPWVPYDPDFERRARLAAVDSVRGQAEEMGILRDARRNAEQTIQTLLRMLGAVKIVFVPT